MGALGPFIWRGIRIFFAYLIAAAVSAILLLAGYMIFQDPTSVNPFGWQEQGFIVFLILSLMATAMAVAFTGIPAILLITVAEGLMLREMRYYCLGGILIGLVSALLVVAFGEQVFVREFYAVFLLVLLFSVLGWGAGYIYWYLGVRYLVDPKKD